MHGRRRRPPPSDIIKCLRTAVFQKYANARPIYRLSDEPSLFNKILELSRTDDFETAVSNAKEQLHGTQHYNAYMALATLFLNPFSTRNNLPNRIEFIRASRYANKNNAKEIIQILLQWLLLFRIDQDIKALIDIHGYREMLALIEWKEEATAVLRIKGKKHRLFLEPKPLLLPLICLVVSTYFLLQCCATYSNSKNLAEIGTTSCILQCSLAALSTGASYITRQYTLTHIYEKVTTFSPAAITLLNITTASIVIPGAFFLIVAHYMGANPIKVATPIMLFCAATYTARQLFFKTNENVVEEREAATQDELLIAN